MRDLSLLHPWMKAKAIELMALCKSKGVPIMITSTLRTASEQNALYAKGRTTAGSIVTNARYPQSLHCWGCAIDFVPLVNGVPTWSNTALFDKVGALGKSIGLVWGGNFISLVDKPHFQMPNVTWSALQTKWGTPEAYIKSWVTVPVEGDEEVDKIKVVINGKVVEGFVTSEGVSYVPARIISEALGATITWDGATQTVTITK